MVQLQLSLPRLFNASRCQQRMRSCAFKPAARCRPVMAIQHKRTEQPSSSSECVWQQALPVAALLPLICAGAAFADDASLDAAYAAAYAQDTGTNTIVTIMAGIVFVLLVLVTGGVAYLNLANWLDNRQEKKDQETPVVRSAVSASMEEEEVKKRVRVKREKRGFGSN